MKNFRFLLKHACTLCSTSVPAIVACFAVCMMFAGCEWEEEEDPDLGTEAIFRSFTFDDIDGSADINGNSLTIKAKAKASADLKKITPTFRVSSGASVKVGNKNQVSGKTENDFTNAVIYIVTSEDGKTNKSWTVTITKEGTGPGTDPEPGDLANITAFTFNGIEGTATINVITATVTAKASAATNLTNLAPTFSVSKGAKVTVNGVSQTSGVTQNNFTNPVTYTVVSEDGKTTRPWTVTITKEGGTPPLGEKALFTAFTFTGIVGTATINESASTITAKASETTNLTSIAPTFTVSQGAKVTVNGVSQTSGVTQNNFTNPVTYTVVSEDGKTTKTWTVTITKDSGGGGGGGGGGTEPGHIRGAVKYKLITDGVVSGEMALTFDNSKGLFRSDSWQSGMHFISIVDRNNKIIHMYTSMTGTWTSIPYTEGSESSGDYDFDETVAIFQPLPNRTIAGKVCTAWRITLKDGSAEYIQAVWQGLLMYHEPVRPKGTIMEATAATLEFPDSAFSQSSINVTWL